VRADAGLNGTTALPAAYRVAAGGAILLALALLTITRADPDLWGHLRAGLDTLRWHRLDPVDPYSFAQDRPLVYHEWFSELQMGIAYRALGTAGLAMLKGILAFLAIALAWGASRGAAFQARMAAAALFVLATAPLTQTLRPQLWTLVCLVGLCRLLASGAPVQTASVPMLLAVWANLHGGWIVGLGTVGLWALGVVARQRTDVVRWAVIVTLALAATLLTPYGLGLWRFLLDTVGMGRPQIEEWQPLWKLSPQVWMPWIVGAAATMFIAVNHRTVRWAPASLVVLLPLAWASLRVARVGPLFAAAAVTWASGVFASRFARPPVALPRGRDQWIAALLVVVVAAGLSARVLATSLTCVAIPDSPLMPDRAAAGWLRGAQPGRLVTFFNWGEYAFWHFGPRLRVSMDGRREAVYSDERLAQHDAILAGSVLGFETLAAWNPEYVWLPATATRTREWLASHHYRIDVETPQSFIAVRGDLPRLAAPPAAPTPPCFPG
jgi:hypothetical protein